MEKIATPKKLSEPAKEDSKVQAVKKTTPSKKGKVDAYVSFEVCKSCTTYRRRANERFTEVAEILKGKNLEILINEHGPPRRGAFEISVLHKKDDTANAKLIWSGLKKGPPRRQKFPDTKDIIDAIKKAV